MLKLPRLRASGGAVGPRDIGFPAPEGRSMKSLRLDLAGSTSSGRGGGRSSGGLGVIESEYEPIRGQLALMRLRLCPATRSSRDESFADNSLLKLSPVRNGSRVP